MCAKPTEGCGNLQEGGQSYHPLRRSLDIRRVGHGVGQAGFHRFSRGAFPKMVYTFIGKILLG